MIEPLIYCKVCGMTMQCIGDFYREFGRRPVVLEIGCADGQGTMRFAGFCECVICVDPMVADRPDIFSRVKGEYPADTGKVELFTRRTSEFPVKLAKASSLWPEAIAEVKSLLGNTKIDILVIDGCHHPFEAVWGDFDAYYPLVSTGGYVIFDDLYEDCILKAYEQAAAQHGMIKHDRWGINKPDALQDCASLKKTEG